MIWVLPALAGDKAVHEALGEFPSAVERADLVVKWGPKQPFSAADAEALADAFEFAWAAEIGELGWPAPRESDAWKLNIYVSGTGGDAPPSYGADGYYTRDDAGFPMIVVAADVLPDHEFAAETAAHELNHASQDAAATFDQQGSNAWFWEATAVWMAGLVRPESPTWPKLLFGWAFRPEVSIDHFQRPDGTVEGYHHYGAFVFLRHLSEIEADPDLVRDAWLQGGDSPVAALDARMVERGSSLDAAFLAFTARAATWDYADGDLYRAWLEDRGEYYDSHVPADTLVADGGARSSDVPLSRYGAQYWRLPAIGGDATLTVDGDVTVTVARVDGGVHSRETVDGSLILHDLTAADEAWVAVAALEGESFPYALALTRIPAEIEDVPPEPETCSCGTARGSWALALLATVCCRRRR